VCRDWPFNGPDFRWRQTAASRSKRAGRDASGIEPGVNRAGHGDMLDAVLSNRFTTRSVFGVRRP
jgi:hypothetical protein